MKRPAAKTLRCGAIHRHNGVNRKGSQDFLKSYPKIPEYWKMLEFAVFFFFPVVTKIGGVQVPSVHRSSV